MDFKELTSQMSGKKFPESVSQYQIVANTLDEAWHLALMNILANGRKIQVDEGSHAGDYRVE